MEVRVSLASRDCVLRQLGAPAATWHCPTGAATPAPACRGRHISGHCSPDWKAGRLEGLELRPPPPHPRPLQGSQAPRVWNGPSSLPGTPTEARHTGAGVTTEGMRKPGWEVHLLQKSLNQEGVELGRGRGWGERRGPVPSCSEHHLLYGGTDGDIQGKAAANTGRNTATPHSPKQSTPKEPLGDETPF